MTKKQLATEDEVAKLSSNVTQYQSSMSQLETSLEEERSRCQTLQSQVDTLTESEASSRKSEKELESSNSQLEERVKSLERQLLQCQTELKLTQRVSRNYCSWRCGYGLLFYSMNFLISKSSSFYKTFLVILLRFVLDVMVSCAGQGNKCRCHYFNNG